MYGSDVNTCYGQLTNSEWCAGSVQINAQRLIMSLWSWQIGQMAARTFVGNSFSYRQFRLALDSSDRLDEAEKAKRARGFRRFNIYREMWAQGRHRISWIKAVRLWIPQPWWNDSRFQRPTDDETARHFAVMFADSATSDVEPSEVEEDHVPDN